MEDKRKVIVCGQEVILDGGKLYFSEGTLSEYLENEGSWIAYFGAKLADAELQFAQMEIEVEKQEDEYERIYSKVFTTLKERGGSDKFVEGLSKVEPTVIAARHNVLEVKVKAIEAKHIVKLIYQHLRAWDRNHENAQNRGNTLRKELDRLYKDRITYDDKIDEIVKSVNI